MFQAQNKKHHRNLNYNNTKTQHTFPDEAVLWKRWQTVSGRRRGEAGGKGLLCKDEAKGKRSLVGQSYAAVEQ